MRTRTKRSFIIYVRFLNERKQNFYFFFTGISVLPETAAVHHAASHCWRHKNLEGKRATLHPCVISGRAFRPLRCPGAQAQKTLEVRVVAEVRVWGVFLALCLAAKVVQQQQQQQQQFSSAYLCWFFCSLLLLCAPNSTHQEFLVAPEARTQTAVDEKSEIMQTAQRARGGNRSTATPPLSLAPVALLAARKLFMCGNYSWLLVA